MMEPKPFASLTAGLLARKGGARPAMRRAYVPGMAAPSLPASVQDDLGWNDMGESHEEPTPPPLTVVRNDGSIVQDRSRPPAPAAAPAAEPRKEHQTRVSALGASRAAKAAFTLRLDPERHLRLRLACATSHRSAQQIVTEALDAFLNARPQIEALAQQVPLPDEGREQPHSD